MPGLSPILNLPYAVDTDPVKQYPSAVDEPRTIELERLLGAMACLASGSFSAGVVGSNYVNLTTLDFVTSDDWVLNAGQLVAPWAGVYFLMYGGGIDSTVKQTQVWIGFNSSWKSNLTSASIAFEAHAPVLVEVAAGDMFAKPQVYAAPAAGSSGIGKLTAIYLGK